MYLNLYKIDGTTNLDSNPCFNFDDTYPNFQNHLNKFKMHLKDLVDKKESTERELNSNDHSYLNEFGINVESDVSLKINKYAFDVLRDTDIPVESKFDIWLDGALNMIGKRRQSLTAEHLRNSLKKFNRLFSTLTVNTELGKFNERDNYYAIATKTKAIYDGQNFIGTQILEMEVVLKGPDNKITKNKNNSSTKVTPFELNNEKGLFSWINGKDVLQRKEFKDEEGRINEVLTSKFGFFSSDELNILNDALIKNGFTIALSRGDSDKLAIVKIESVHRDYASAPKEYF